MRLFIGFLLGMAAAKFLVAIAFAQAPGVVPESWWTQLLDAAKAAGWFGTLMMTIMWWLERGERRDMQALLMGEKGQPGLLEKSLNTFHAGTDALNLLRASLKVPPS